jgi:hypothetical protein
VLKEWARTWSKARSKLLLERQKKQTWLPDAAAKKLAFMNVGA